MNEKSSVLNKQTVLEELLSYGTVKIVVLVDHVGTKGFDLERATEGVEIGRAHV